MDFANLLSAVVLVAFFCGVIIFAKGLRRLEATVDRMEAQTKVVAHDLAATAAELKVAAKQRTTQGETLDRMEMAAHVIADNLADSVSRADATQGPEGAAADAALRTGDTAAEITKRQERAR